MLINQHDTSWQNDLPTRVDEMGNFLIYILHGTNMHNLLARIETAFDVPRLQRVMFPFDLSQYTTDAHNEIFVLFGSMEIFIGIATQLRYAWAIFLTGTF